MWPLARIVIFYVVLPILYCINLINTGNKLLTIISIALLTIISIALFINQPLSSLSHTHTHTHTHKHDIASTFKYVTHCFCKQLYPDFPPQNVGPDQNCLQDNLPRWLHADLFTLKWYLKLCWMKNTYIRNSLIQYKKKDPSFS